MRNRLIELLLSKSCMTNRCPDVDCEKCECIAVHVGDADKIADYLLANGVIVLPCDVGAEIKGEIVHEIDYHKSLMATGETIITKKIYTCDKEDVRAIVFCCHPMTWEEAEAKLKEGAE